jgi:hypothetical protein
MILELPDDLPLVEVNNFARENGLTLRWKGQGKLRAYRNKSNVVPIVRRTVRTQQPTFDGPGAAA